MASSPSRVVMEGRSSAEEPREETADNAVDVVAQRLFRELLLHNGKETETRAGHQSSSGAPCQIEPEAVEPEWDAASLSPPSLMDTCGPSTSSCSSSCSGPALPRPWLPTVELGAVLTDTRLTLDVYQGGAAGLPHLWRSVPEQLSGVRYLRLGSEDEESLSQALGVLHRLPHLRSLAIRGNDMFIWLSQG